MEEIVGCRARMTRTAPLLTKEGMGGGYANARMGDTIAAHDRSQRNAAGSGEIVRFATPPVSPLGKGGGLLETRPGSNHARARNTIASPRRSIRAATVRERCSNRAATVREQSSNRAATVRERSSLSRELEARATGRICRLLTEQWHDDSTKGVT